MIHCRRVIALPAGFIITFHQQVVPQQGTEPMRAWRSTPHMTIHNL